MCSTPCSTSRKAKRGNCLADDFSLRKAPQILEALRLAHLRKLQFSEMRPADTHREEILDLIATNLSDHEAAVVSRRLRHSIDGFTVPLGGMET